MSHFVGQRAEEWSHWVSGRWKGATHPLFRPMDRSLLEQEFLHTGWEAYRWTAAGGVVGLGWLQSQSSPGSLANGVSADGSVVVGYGFSRADLVTEAFRWTGSGGMVGLGDLPGGTFDSVATEVSADGSVIVGQGTSANGKEAFYWTSAHGMVGLRGLLIAGGATNVSGWSLNDAHAISDDGLTIVGVGINPSGATEAWLASIPEPGTWVLAAVGVVASAMVVCSRRGRSIKRAEATRLIVV